MASHWTYETAGAALQQGDILTPELLVPILDDTLPYFKSNKHVAFIITTQSCDLVNRRGGPKARYINIASVRDFRSVWPKLLSSCIQPVAPDTNVYRKKDQAKARDLLKRILDQNEQGIGLFYLHPDADLQIGTAWVAFLRVTISLRADHYKTLVEARQGTLNEEFRAKFGWLVGNLYSRVASRDWGDDPSGKNQYEEMTSDILDKTPGITWLDESHYRAYTKNKIDLASEAELAHLTGTTAPKKIDEVADRVVERIKQLQTQRKIQICATDKNSDLDTILRKQIANDPRIKNLIGTD